MTRGKKKKKGQTTAKIENYLKKIKKTRKEDPENQDPEYDDTATVSLGPKSLRPSRSNGLKG